MTPEEIDALADQVLAWQAVPDDDITPDTFMMREECYDTFAPILAQAWKEERAARQELERQVGKLKSNRDEWDIEHFDSPNGYIAWDIKVEAVPGLDREALEDAFGQVAASACDCGKDLDCSIEHYQSSTGVKCLFHEDMGNETHGGAA